MLLNLRRKPQHAHDLGHPGRLGLRLSAGPGVSIASGRRCCRYRTPPWARGRSGPSVRGRGPRERHFGHSGRGGRSGTKSPARPPQGGFAICYRWGAIWDSNPYGPPPLKIALPALDLHLTTDIDCIVFVSPRMELPRFSGRLIDWDSGGAPQFQYGDVFSLLLRWVLPHRAALFAIHRLILRRSAIVT